MKQLKRADELKVGDIIRDTRGMAQVISIVPERNQLIIKYERLDGHCMTWKDPDARGTVYSPQNEQAQEFLEGLRAKHGTKGR